MKLRLLVMFVTLLAVLPAQADVNVKINGQLYRYQQPVRLSQMLAPVVANGTWYWPACTLYKEGDAKVEALRHDVISLIDTISLDLRPRDEKARALRSLRQQVEGWHLAKRLPVSLNYDAARLDIRQNPMLQDGNYILRLSGRPQVVWMSGAVSTPGSYEYQAQSAAFDYAEGIAQDDYADPDYVYVISPEGNVKKRNVAYWGWEFNQVMPGSQVYVPLFTWLLSPDVEELNEKVAQLAVHRVLP